MSKYEKQTAECYNKSCHNLVTKLINVKTGEVKGLEGKPQFPMCSGCEIRFLKALQETVDWNNNHPEEAKAIQDLIVIRQSEDAYNALVKRFGDPNGKRKRN